MQNTKTLCKILKQFMFCFEEYFVSLVIVLRYTVTHSRDSDNNTIIELLICVPLIYVYISNKQKGNLGKRKGKLLECKP